MKDNVYECIVENYPLSFELKFKTGKSSKDGIYFNDLSVFGKRVKEQRKRLGYSAKELAAEIGCDEAHLNRMEMQIRKIENGQKPSLELLYMLSNALDCSPYYLLGKQKCRKVVGATHVFLNPCRHAGLKRFMDYYLLCNSKECKEYEIKYWMDDESEPKRFLSGRQNYREIITEAKNHKRGIQIIPYLQDDTNEDFEGNSLKKLKRASVFYQMTYFTGAEICKDGFYFSKKLNPYKDDELDELAERYERNEKINLYMTVSIPRVKCEEMVKNFICEFNLTNLPEDKQKILTKEFVDKLAGKSHSDEDCKKMIEEFINELVDQDCTDEKQKKLAGRMYDNIWTMWREERRTLRMEENRTRLEMPNKKAYLGMYIGTMLNLRSYEEMRESTDNKLKDILIVQTLSDDEDFISLAWFIDPHDPINVYGDKLNFIFGQKAHGYDPSPTKRYDLIDFLYNLCSTISDNPDKNNLASNIVIDLINDIYGGVYNKTLKGKEILTEILKMLLDMNEKQLCKVYESIRNL